MKWRELQRGYVGRLEALRRQKPHEVLRVSASATPAEVQAAYRRLVKVYHPDRADAFVRNCNAEVLKIVNHAYEELRRVAARRK